MADWQRTLDLRQAFADAQSGKASAQATAKSIYELLENLTPFGDGFYFVDQEKEELIQWFKDFSEDEDGDFDDLDFLLQDLYNWADQSLDSQFGGKKVCWIKTF